MNLAIGQLIGAAWALSGLAVLLARLQAIGWFGIFDQELELHRQRGNNDQFFLDMYFKVARAKRALGVSPRRPRLHDVIGLPMTLLVVVIYIIQHLLFGPIMFTAFGSWPTDQR